MLLLNRLQQVRKIITSYLSIHKAAKYKYTSLPELSNSKLIKHFATI